MSKPNKPSRPHAKPVKTSNATFGPPLPAAQPQAATAATAGPAGGQQATVVTTTEAEPSPQAPISLSGKRSVLIQVRSDTITTTVVPKTLLPFGKISLLGDTVLNLSIADPLAGIEIDPAFGRVELPAKAGPSAKVSVLSALGFALPQLLGYVVRAVVTAEEELLLAQRPQVQVFADPPIRPFVTCGDSAAVGTWKDVAAKLGVSRLAAAGLDGRDVLVAIVDTGINLAHLKKQGLSPNLDAARSWTPDDGGTAGEYDVDHGTMCAFDALIAAPNCTLLDVPVLRSATQSTPVMEGYLSNAVKAYNHLIDVLQEARANGRSVSLVVNNSWGMYDPAWDYPVDHPGNYSDNPNHPFNQIVAALEQEGADILFAAGNCGADCPDDRCAGHTTNAIYGANGHADVLCVAGVDLTGERVGYSTTGPGRLSRLKPDLSGYTHFAGSKVYATDGGTSAATPVVAGVIAAVRTLKPFDPSDPSTTPAVLRAQLLKSAADRGGTGYDYEYGWGVIDPLKFAGLVAAPARPTPALPVVPLRPQIPPPAPVADREPCVLVLETSAADSDGMKAAFGRISPDPLPGENVLILRGLPPGTRGISVWMTEWTAPNAPTAGDARFRTLGVQLAENGTECRIEFALDGVSRHVPAAAQILYARG